jgi:diacylglycerol kinase family enzyme
MPSAAGFSDLSAQSRRRIGLISNPHSGRNRQQLRHVERIVAGCSQVTHYRTETAQDIAGALADMASKSIDVVAINGGDGTTAEVFTRLLQQSPFEHLPAVALLPGGTTNMNAGDVGLRGNLIKSVKHLCQWAESRHSDGRLIARPVLRVEPGLAQSAVYGMFFGTGAIIQGIEYCHASIHSKGLRDGIGPGLAMARTVWGLMRRDPRFTRPVCASLRLNDAPATPREDILLLLVSSLERLFLGMRPYWGSESGPLHVSLIRDRPQRFLRTFPNLLRGRPGRFATVEAGYRSHNAERIGLVMDGTFTLDGEMYQVSSADGPVLISNGGDIRFLRL